MRMAAPTPPGHWRKVLSPMPEAGTYWMHSIIKMTVMRSLSTMKDGKCFIHVSMARPDRLPTWEELKKIKDEFIGEEVPAYHVLPAKDDYVNVHPYCLHLWSPENYGDVANLHSLALEEAI